MKITHEKIFGPLLPVLTHHHIDDAIRRVNARPRPLALCYFGDEDAEPGALYHTRFRAMSGSTVRCDTLHKTIFRSAA
ncbi:hypothetical protein PQQ75_31945 [Paraburkholderia aspalathi]